MPIEQEESVEERVNRRYQTIEGGKPKLQISLKDLLEKGGVNIYDLQIAIDQNPSILQKMEVEDRTQAAIKAIRENLINEVQCQH